MQKNQFLTYFRVMRRQMVKELWILEAFKYVYGFDRQKLPIFIY